jgi:hypothetical protein
MISPHSMGLCAIKSNQMICSADQVTGSGVHRHDNMMFRILGARQNDYCCFMKQKVERINELDIGYVGFHYTKCIFLLH